ncbi:MAG: hypothetical protein JWQ21_2271 [Herminiimonas sp.]|nr:hypothetical protein [Herminiimonas sp.]
MFIASLFACGGGGGGDPASQAQTSGADAAVTASIAGPQGGANLLISEVGTNYYDNDVAWLEVYNPGTVPVALSNYTLRSAYVDPATSIHSATPADFSLPAVNVPAKAYVVIAGGVYDKLKDNSQIVYVKNGNAVPFWNADGSIELVAAGKTADFVRFGASTTEPATAGEWAGNNVAALPSGINDHGKSIVRLASGGMADSNTASDWTLVNFATPAGINDVAANVVDSDLDGIPDSAKISGGAYGGLDLYAMGARPGRRDIFIEIDYMTGTDPALTPRKEALQKFVDAFAEKNIAVHLDAGNLYSAAYDPALFNLGGGNPVAFATCIELAMSSATAKPGCASLQDYKNVHFDVRRKDVFHYAMFANSLNLSGGAGSSGVAEIFGNDLIVSLGGYGLNNAPGSSLNLLINLQASTLMHEFGHNLGLLHGGNEDVNYKPNHYSVMNYLYQFAGLSATPDSINAAERYYLANGFKNKTYCTLIENSPCGPDFKMSYSDGTSADLDENNLSEQANIGRGSVLGAYADWNDDGVPTGVQSYNIHSQDGTAKGILKDYNEWANLKFAFSRGLSGNNSGNTFSASLRANPRNGHIRRQIAESPLPAEMHDLIRRTHGPYREAGNR